MKKAFPLSAFLVFFLAIPAISADSETKFRTNGGTAPVQSGSDDGQPVRWIAPDILEKLRNIKPSTGKMNPIIIPGISKSQAIIFASKPYQDAILTVEASTIEDAMPEVSNFKGNREPVIIAKGRTTVPQGFRGIEGTFKDLAVTVVVNSKGQLLVRSVTLPKGK
jgi:hypothetical protein